MKKILVVLLILAVAGGVFAQQGTWSLSGSARVGARITLDPDPLHDGDVALIRGSMYQRPYGQYTTISGDLGINYTRGALGTGLFFATTGEITGTLNGTGENYKFQAVSNLNEFFSNAPEWSDDGAGDKKFINRLWGSYSMLNELVLIEVAYRSRDNGDDGIWASDTTAAIDDANFQIPYTYTVTTDANGNYKIDKRPNNRRYRVTSGNVHDFREAAPSNSLFNNWKTFTKVDRANYLLGEVSTGGLQLGLMIPNVFSTRASAGFNGWEGQTPSLTTFNGVNGGRWGSGVNFIDETLKQSIFGAKFSMHPVEVAAQLKFEDFGVYFGGRFFAGPITVGLSFMGTMGNVPLSMTGTGGPQYTYDQSQAQTQRTFGNVINGSVSKLGGRVDYNGGSFGAGIKGFWGKQGGKGGQLNAQGQDDGTGDGLDYYYTIIGIEPTFFINAIPSHLRFTLNGGFYFETYTAPDFTTAASSDVRATYWALQPEISWNFRGTGAVGGYHSMNTGMFFRYRIVSNAVNALDIAFLFGL